MSTEEAPVSMILAAEEAAEFIVFMSATMVEEVDWAMDWAMMCAPDERE